MEQKKDHPKNSPIKRREFFKLCGSVVAGGTILAVAGGMAVARHIACYLSRP